MKKEYIKPAVEEIDLVAEEAIFTHSIPQGEEGLGEGEEWD